MNSSDLAGPREVSREPIEIRDEDAITISEALAVAGDFSFALGKSTLQRWAKFWYDHPGGAVRCVLVTTRGGSLYKLSREDFEAWVFDQKQNDRPHEAPRDLVRPPKVSQDPERPRETSGETTENVSRAKQFENENFQLKIDLEVRKQLLERAKDEMHELRSTVDNLLRENGGLQYQIRQLAPPATKKEGESDQASTVDNSTPTNDTAAL